MRGPVDPIVACIEVDFSLLVDVVLGLRELRREPIDISWMNWRRLCGMLRLENVGREGRFSELGTTVVDLLMH